MDANTVRIFHIALEGVSKEVQLEAEGHHSPVLEAEGGEKRLATADVEHVLHAEHIELVEVDLALVFVILTLFLLLWLRILHFDVLRRFLLSLLCLVATLTALCGLFLGSSLCLHLFFSRSSLRPGLPRRRGGGPPRLPGGLVGRPLRHGGLVGVLLRMPRLQSLLPILPLGDEPIPGLQVFNASGRLFLLDPLLQVVAALVLFGPIIPDLIEAFVLVRDAELDKGRVQRVGGQVRNRIPAEDQFLFFSCQLHLRRLLIHRLVLFLLLFFLLLRLLRFLLFLFLLFFVLLAGSQSLGLFLRYIHLLLDLCLHLRLLL
mmetsp:Transcript_87314/g.226771  ORF Transcript_87314/g.226771 Transcript_87314/m.226771 type:complete len:317 (-) Transcript_87314:1407-2357(-)